MESIYAMLKTISDFVAKILDAIKQVFDSFKPADPEAPSEESADA